MFVSLEPLCINSVHIVWIIKVFNEGTLHIHILKLNDKLEKTELIQLYCPTKF